MTFFPLRLGLLFALFITLVIVSGSATASAQDDTFASHGPRLTLRINPSYFSPNGDGRQDAAFFELDMEDLGEVKKWRIDVTNESGRRVMRFKGPGSPSELTEWHGTDEKIRILPEGNYAVQATVRPRGPGTNSEIEVVTLDLSPPELELEVSIPAFSPDGDGRDDTVTFLMKALDDSPLNGWTLEAKPIDNGQTTLFTATGTFEKGQYAYVWDGRSNQSGATLPNGLYNITLSAEDAAGNIRIHLPSAVEIKGSPELTLKKLKAQFDIKTTARGYVIHLPSKRIFKSAASRHLSSKSGNSSVQLLRLIQSYKGYNIHIEGFNGSEKTASKREDLSSNQAWALYSYLVKSGVQSKRIKVNGRGGLKGSKNFLKISMIQPGQEKSSNLLEGLPGIP